MKYQQLVKALSEVAVFFAIVLTFVWILPKSDKPALPEHPPGDVHNKIRNEQIREAVFGRDAAHPGDGRQERFEAGTDRRAACALTD